MCLLNNNLCLFQGSDGRFYLKQVTKPEIGFQHSYFVLGHNITQHCRQLFRKKSNRYIYIEGLKISQALLELMETTSTVYIHGRMYGDGVDEHFHTELTGHINMDGVINATNEHCQSNRKMCRNAIYFNPRREILQIIH